MLDELAEVGIGATIVELEGALVTKLLYIGPGDGAGDGPTAVLDSSEGYDEGDGCADDATVRDEAETVRVVESVRVTSVVCAALDAEL